MYNLVMHEQQNDRKILKDSFTHPEVFGILYEKYHDPIYRHLYKLTQDIQITEDLTEETFLRVLEKRRLILKSKIPFDRYIYKISTNLAIGYFRKERRKRKFQGNLQVKHKIKEGIERPERYEDELLKREINNLAEIERVCIIMYYFEHKKMDEIAVTLGKAKSSISVLLKSARKHLYEKLRTKTSENRNNV